MLTTALPSKRPADVRRRAVGHIVIVQFRASARVREKDAAMGDFAVPGTPLALLLLAAT